MARSNAYPISWHKECLANSRATLAEREASLARMQAEVDRHRADVDFHARQIAEAEARGMDSFDRDKLLKHRRAAA